MSRAFEFEAQGCVPGIPCSLQWVVCVLCRCSRQLLLHPGRQVPLSWTPQHCWWALALPAKALECLMVYQFQRRRPTVAGELVRPDVGEWHCSSQLCARPGGQTLGTGPPAVSRAEVA